MIRPFLPLLSAFGVWAIAFLALYSVQALGCVWNWPPMPHRLALIALLCLTIALQALILLRHRAASRANPGPLPTAALGLSLAAMAASILTFSPSLFATLCV